MNLQTFNKYARKCQREYAKELVARGVDPKRAKEIAAAMDLCVLSRDKSYYYQAYPERKKGDSRIYIVEDYW